MIEVSKGVTLVASVQTITNIAEYTDSEAADTC
jgi:hypothetical protein